LPGLEIEKVPATVACQGCDAISTLDVPLLAYGSCERSTVTLLTGKEFLVVSLEIVEV